MKVKDIALIELIDHIKGEDEEYTYTSKYERESNNVFTVNFSSTSNTRICKYCGEWLFIDNVGCLCGGETNYINEKDVIEKLEESLNDPSTKIKINGTPIN